MDEKSSRTKVGHRYRQAHDLALTKLAQDPPPRLSDRLGSRAFSLSPALMATLPISSMPRTKITDHALSRLEL